MSSLCYLQQEPLYQQSVDKLANDLELVKLELGTQAKGPLYQPLLPFPPRSVKKSSSSSFVHRNKGGQASRVVSQGDDSLRKFNVVMYGVSEPASGTSRNTHTVKDYQSVVSAAESADVTVSVSDCYRLGRFFHPVCQLLNSHKGEYFRFFFSSDNFVENVCISPHPHSLISSDHYYHF